MSHIERPGNASRPPSTPAGDDWLLGGGEMGDLIRRFDWSGTPFGPRADWPLSLKTIVNVVVESSFPMALLWGPELLLLYNDAYRVIAADRHPRALGRSTREVWAEVWPINEPIFAAVMERGETLHFEDKLFQIGRQGRREKAYFTLCYSPVRVEDGTIGGTLVVLQETTLAIERQEQLQENHERLRAVIEHLPEGLCIADATGRMRLCGRARKPHAATRRSCRS